MHRSRLTHIMIDCNQDVMEQGMEFWSAALGLEVVREDERYVRLTGADQPVKVVLQSVEDDSAIHLDIQTDDVEAEVARLEKLGAVRKYKRHTWWVMRAPTGHDFCVIRAQSEDFPDAAANTWDDE